MANKKQINVKKRFLFFLTVFSIIFVAIIFYKKKNIVTEFPQLKYNFIYATGLHYHYPRPFYLLAYKITKTREIPFDTKLMLHEVATNTNREISFEEAQELSLLQLPSESENYSQTYGLGINTISPEGIEIIDHEFKVGEETKYSWKLKYKNNLQDINITTVYPHVGDFHFLGWIIPSQEYFSLAESLGIIRKRDDFTKVTAIEEDALISLFPTFDGNNTFPTFSGKIFQDRDILLDTKFSLKETIYNPDQKRNALEFISGKLKNIKVEIDGNEISVIEGFAQYPEIECDISYVGDSLSYSDKLFYGDSPGLEPLETEQECIDKKRYDLPPVFFFFKPTKSLSIGSHTIKITSQGVTKTFDFIIDMTESVQSSTDAFNVPLKITSKDACPSNYYYTRALPIPSVPLISPYKYTKLYFPQNSDEIVSFNPNHMVKITFGGRLYDLNLPTDSILYSDAERKANRLYLSNRYLFLPHKNLRFADGNPIKIWKGNSSMYSAEYLELIPVDSNGLLHFSKKVPYQTINSSSCDG